MVRSFLSAEPTCLEDKMSAPISIRIDEDGKLYDEPYAGKPVGRYKDGKVLDIGC